MPAFPPPITRFRPVTSPAAVNPVQNQQSDSLFRLYSQVKSVSYRNPQQQSFIKLLRGVPQDGEYFFGIEPALHTLRETMAIAQPYTCFAGDDRGAQEVKCDVARTGPLLDIQGQYVTIRDLWFTDQSPSVTIRVSGFFVRIERCVFDCSGVAIEVVDGTQEVTIDNCLFLQGARQVDLQGTQTRARVTMNRFMGLATLPDASIYASDNVTDSLYDGNIATGAAASLLSVKALTGYSIGTAIGTVTVRP